MMRLTASSTATLALLLFMHVGAALAWAGLYTHLFYLLLDVLYLILAGHLILLAFCLARRRPASWQALLARGLLCLSTLPLLLAAADVYIIAFRCDTSGLGGIHCFTHFNWHKRYARSNQLGYWERDLSPYLDENQARQEVVIAAVGDSWTWGQGVHGKQYRFTNVLEAKLQGRTARPVVVLNFGRCGADTNEERQILDDAAKVRPDFVLIGYLSNDIDRYAAMRFRAIETPPLERRLTLLSPTANFLYWRIRAPHIYRELGERWSEAISAAYQDSATMGKHLADIEALIAQVRQMNAKPIFVLLPFPSMWQGNGGADRHLRDQVYGTIAQKVRSLDVPAIEAYRLEDEMTVAEFALNPMDTHPNEAAHRRMAEFIAAEFVKQHRELRR